MRPRTRTAVVGLLFVLCMCVVTWDSPAQAAGPCARQDHYFNGYQHNAPAYYPFYDFEALQGYIVVRDGELCGGAFGIGNYTDSWVMIAGSSHDGWSQVGFERTCGYPLRWFSQHRGEGKNQYAVQRLQRRY